uniref:DUF4974 domain-containing protein n=1 Tax=Prevotella sp. GTC17253 TaxID=3236793 RepID=A0AB33IRE9_9BACT
MRKIEQDFLNNKANTEQLKTLRQHVNASDDAQLGADIQQQWMQEDLDTSEVDTDILKKIWYRVENQTRGGHRIHSLLWKAIQVAAVFLIPLFMFTTYYFYRQKSAYENGEVTFTTDKGEQACVVLPDGSKVRLNELTTLRYNTTAFNQYRREVIFDGQGYFEIHKDAKHPLVISSDRLSIKVLGTIFNLTTHRNSSQASLELSEGSVDFSHIASGRVVHMSPGQRAVLNKQTGQFAVSMMQEDFDYYTAWNRKELVFRNTPLTAVFEELEQTYSVSIKCNPRVKLSEQFTGTMASNNLQENLEILETSFHLKATKYGKNILITTAK